MKRLGILGIVVLISLYFYWNQRYVQFFPVDFNNEEYVTVENSPPIDFYNNLTIVLSYYEVEFKEEKNTVWVKYSTFKDKEMCYSYTKKAKDSIWLSSK